MNASRREREHSETGDAPLPWMAATALLGFAIALSTTIGFSPSTLLALLFWFFLA